MAFVWGPPFSGKREGRVCEKGVEWSHTEGSSRTRIFWPHGRSVEELADSLVHTYYKRRSGRVREGWPAIRWYDVVRDARGIHSLERYEQWSAEPDQHAEQGRGSAQGPDAPHLVMPRCNLGCRSQPARAEKAGCRLWRCSPAPSGQGHFSHKEPRLPGRTRKGSEGWSVGSYLGRFSGAGPVDAAMIPPQAIRGEVARGIASNSQQ